MTIAQQNVEKLAELEGRWRAIRDFDPNDRSARENLAAVQLELSANDHPIGSIARGHQLLRIGEEGFPIPKLQAAYFENLELLLKQKARLASPGRPVVGLGSGRCGSTSLTAIMAGVEGSCSTHENPPMIYWPPEKEQLEFHFRRTSLLIEFFPLVFDASLWWLPALSSFFEYFPTAKAIGLYRDVQSCAQSFLQNKGTAWGSVNHWVAPANGIWRANLWDPTYPTYPLPQDADANPDGAKLRLITRYVEEYNTELFALGKQLPERFMLVRMEELNDFSIQNRIFDFIGLPGRASQAVLNVGTAHEGADAYWF
jgi:hypothetical protein